MADHLIGKQTFELDLAAGVDSYDIQQRTSGHFHRVLLPRIEAIFDKLAGENQVIRLDSLEIDLGTLDAENFEAAFEKKLLVALERALKERIGAQGDTPADPVQVSEGEDLWQQVLHFLEKGWLSGWKSPTLPEGWEEKAEAFLLSDSRAIRSLANVLQKASARRRLARLASPTFLVFILKENEKGSWLARLFEALPLSFDLGKLNNQAWTTLLEWAFSPATVIPFEQRRLAKEILRVATLSEVSAENLLEIFATAKAPSSMKKAVEAVAGNRVEIADLTAENDLASSPETLLNEPEATSESAEILATHAGLVLIHPFINRHFEAVGLLAEGKFKDTAARETAVLLLGYLATGKAHLPEYELVVPKLLCGMPLQTTLDPDRQPSQEALDEADHLLEIVISYWEALKNTSVDGLREAFLTRPGKLSQQTDGWHIDVETRTLDILLNRLPWGLSMVHLPWNNTLIYVNWNP